MPQNSTPFRIAIRQFEPFANAMSQEWARFCDQEGLNIPLEAESLELHDLFDSLHTQSGLLNGAWDIAFCPTDWLALLHAQEMLVDLTPFIHQSPPSDFPDGWADSLLRMQMFGEATLGLPYHDGPECLVYRKDLFADAEHRKAFAQMHGRPLEVPRTWDDFVEVARYFHSPAGGFVRHGAGRLSGCPQHHLRLPFAALDPRRFCADLRGQGVPRYTRGHCSPYLL